MNPKRIDNVTTRVLPDGYVVLFTKENSWAQTLTPLGGMVWEYCDGRHSVDEIHDEIDKLRDEQDVEVKGTIPYGPPLTEAIGNLITELCDQGLLSEPVSAVTESASINVQIESGAL